VLQGHVHIRQGLSLYALGRVHEQDSAFARADSPRDLVREVYVPGRIDQVKRVFQAVLRHVRQRDGLALDRNAALALDIHIVEHLHLDLALVDDLRPLDETVGERGLAVVYMGYYAEVTCSGDVVHAQNVL